MTVCGRTLAPGRVVVRRTSMFATVHPSRQVVPVEPVYRISVAQYHAAIRAGVFTDDDPIELLEGVLVLKMAKYPPHVIALAKLLRALAGHIPDGWSVRSRAPITLDDGEPEPDLAVIRGRAED